MARLLFPVLLASALLAASCGTKEPPAAKPPESAQAAPGGKAVSPLEVGPNGYVTIDAPAGSDNAVPRVTAIRLFPQSPSPGAPPTYVVEATGVSGGNRRVEAEFTWEKNGEPAGTGRTLGVPLKRGDRVRVTVRPYDAFASGVPVSLEREVGNTPPRVRTGQVGFDGTTWRGRVEGEDNDGDPVSVRLVESPPGMVIDNGVMTWRVPDGFTGAAKVKVLATDGKGGETTGELTVHIRES